MPTALALNWLFTKLGQIELHAVETHHKFVLVIFMHQNNVVIFSLKSSDDGTNMRCTVLIDGKSICETASKQLLRMLGEGFREFAELMSKKMNDLHAFLTSNDSQKQDAKPSIIDLMHSSAKPSAN